MERYPKSPWSGEAYLHLGIAAKEDGRLIEAAQIFQNIADKTSEKPNSKLRDQKRERKQRGGGPLDAEREADITKALADAATLEEAVAKLDSADESDDDDESFEIHMKAVQQLADVDMSMGHYNAAQQHLSEIVRDDLNWRRRTWAKSEMQRASFLSRNAATLMACGPQALGLVLVSQNKANDGLEKVKAPRAQGFSLAELKTLAHQNGVEMDGFKAQPRELANLPLPAILHYDFGPDSSASGQAAPRASNGHFVVLQGVDAASQTVRVYDPSQGRSQRMSYAQLSEQWSGQGLALEKARVRLAVAPLGTEAMKRAVGGQTTNGNRNIGSSENNDVIAGGPSDHGSPVVEINRFSQNMYVHDTPLWYQPSRGPAVEISLSYNSQDSMSYYQRFGRRWMFNYNSYATFAPGAARAGVTIMMPDGSARSYGYDYTTSKHISPPGDFTTVENNSLGGVTLKFQDGTQWVYSNSGTGDVKFLTSIVDPWNNALNLNYDASGKLISILDADQKYTYLDYDSNGNVWRVRDPFGRVATFSYNNYSNPK